MAVTNSIAKKKQQSQLPADKPVEYKCGEETVKLSPFIIRNFLVNGDGNVSDQEVTMFLNLCRFQHLNPFLREAYLIKFGSQPATIVVGKEAITKRAMRNPKFKGQEAGIVIYDEDTGDLEYRSGSLLISGERLVGGWAKVYVDGYVEPIEAVVSIDEYAGVKKDGSMNSQWSRRPATMIRKVALVQALREAFPEELGGMYDVSEMGLDFDDTATAATTPIEIPQDDQPTPAAIQAPQEEVPPVEEIPNF